MSGVTGQPAPALPSATVVLVREHADRAQVLMVLRHPRAAFGNRYAFPGGVLDHQDRSMGAHCAGLSGRDADKLLASDDALAYFSAAARELFVEVGVLLARNGDGAWASVGADTRAALLGGELSWPELLRNNGLHMPRQEVLQV